jgi:hypothetical protein
MPIKAIGEFCNVAVDDFDDMEVNVYCFADGRTWFKVRVPDVTGRITRLTVARRGARRLGKKAPSGPFEDEPIPRSIGLH